MAAPEPSQQLRHAHSRELSDGASLMAGSDDATAAPNATTMTTKLLPATAHGRHPHHHHPMMLHDPTTPPATAAFFIAANMASTVAIVLVNKHIFNAFPWPLLVTFLHQAVCWAFTALTARAGALQVPTLPRRDAMLVGTAMVLGIFLYNVSLKLNSVAVYQLSKMACLPCITVLQKLLYGAAVPSRPVLVSLGILLIGVFLGTEHQFAAHPLGLAAAAAAMFFTSLAQVSIQHMPSMKGISGMQSVAVLSPIATMVLGVLVLLVELPQWIAWGGIGSVPFGYIALSCLLAIAANYFGNSLIQKTSALTYQVVGHLKTILIIIFGAVLFANDDPGMNPTKLAGIILSMVGMIAYSFFKMNPEAKTLRQTKTVIAANISNNPLTWFKCFAAVQTVLLVAIFATFSSHSSSRIAALQKAIARYRYLLSVSSANLSTTNVADLVTGLWNAYDTNNDALFWWDRRPATLPGQDAPDAKNKKKPSVVVISADNRPLVPLESVENQDPAKLPANVMASIYGQWWALRHGYDYRRIDTSAPSGWHSTWGKIKAMYDMVHKYDYVIFHDGDVFINEPSIDLDWMIKKWGFREDASFMMAHEPPYQPKPNDEPDGHAVNTGFVVIRSGPAAKRILRAMYMCPTEVEDCARWRNQWAHEQTVFNKVLRRNGEITDKDLVIIPCGDANGHWEFQACPGKYVTHAWSVKNEVAGKMRDMFVREHVKLYERLLKSGYHITKCTPWQEGVDESCDEPIE